jgi:hypothetical protein
MRDGQSVLNQGVDIKPHGIADVCDTFLYGLALSMTSRQCGTENVVTSAIFFFKDDRKNGGSQMWVIFLA